MMYHNNPNQSAPNNWDTESYTVGKLGQRAWATEIATFTEAEEEQKIANHVAGHGHLIIAEQRFNEDHRSVIVARHE